jgi:hypothetical protein
MVAPETLSSTVSKTVEVWKFKFMNKHLLSSAFTLVSNE